VAFDPQRFFAEFLAAMLARDREALSRLIHPDLVAHMPQTGEQTRGFEGFWAELESYPGGAQNIRSSDVRLLGDEERWAVTPGYTVVPMARASTYTVVGRATYPDGSNWHSIFGVEMRDEKLYRLEGYFAPELPAPLLALVGTEAFNPTGDR
jgi:hypothetical protein